MSNYSEEELEAIASSVCNAIEYRYDETGEVDFVDLYLDRRRWPVVPSKTMLKRTLRWLEDKGHVFRPGDKYALTVKGRAYIRSTK